MKQVKSKRTLLLILLMLAAAVVMVTPVMGIKLLAIGDVFDISNGENRDHTIFWKMRMPRTLVAFMAGSVFAIGGMVFQAIFRNPLVSPFTLGVSAGAALGATICIWLN